MRDRSSTVWRVTRSCKHDGTIRSMKNKKNDPDRLELSKYCPFCRKHTPHKETK